MMPPTVIRGLRLACGSWNTICMVGRILRSLVVPAVAMSLPSILIEPAVTS